MKGYLQLIAIMFAIYLLGYSMAHMDYNPGYECDISVCRP